MKVKVGKNILEIENFSFSETNAWLYFSGETYVYSTIKEVFDSLEMETLIEILTDEDEPIEGHAGYDYLKRITNDCENNIIEVELMQKPIIDRIKNLEETVDILLMSEL